MRPLQILCGSIFVMLLVASGVTQGQTFHHLTGGAFDDRPSCIEKTTDNGYIISGDQSITVYT